MNIDKDTIIFGSFAKTAGNNGCRMFNAAFNFYRINAIYKSFSIDNIENAILAARTLNFKGFAITMPFKKEVINYVDELNEEVEKIGSANTVVNNNGILRAYNTDYLSAKELLKDMDFLVGKNRKLYILGEGGFSLAVQYAAKELNIDFCIINRENWKEIKDVKYSKIFNCTPVENIKVDESNVFSDCNIKTDNGKYLSLIQASHQFKLYTGLDFPIKNNLIF